MDVEYKLIFMNGSFGALLGDCRVLQFEGMVVVFVVKEFVEAKVNVVYDYFWINGGFSNFVGFSGKAF